MFRELGIQNSYTLESSYFRAIPEESKFDPNFVQPTSQAIKYSGLLFDKTEINIDDTVLLEFGKYFAHTVDNYYNDKQQKDLLLLLEEKEEEPDIIQPFYKTKSSMAKPKIMDSFKRNDTAVVSLRSNKRGNKLNGSNLPEGFSSMSISVIKKIENKRDKSAMIKQLHKRHPNSRLFKTEGLPDPSNNIQGIYF